MSYFVLNSLGLLTSLPLVVGGLIEYMHNFGGYEDNRLAYYQDFLGKVLPSLIYILTKKNHDCFSCFNRLEPQKYSTLQYTRIEVQ